MQGFADELVGDVGAVEVAGVNVVDAGVDGLAQNGKGGGVVAWRAEDVGSGKLHGAVAEAVHGGAGAGEGKGAAEGGGLCQLCLFCHRLWISFAAGQGRRMRRVKAALCVYL